MAPTVRLPAVPKVKGLRVVKRTRTTLTIVWKKLGARDIKYLEVHRQHGFLNTLRVAGRARPTQTRFTIRRLKAGTSYLVRVVVHDTAKNFSWPAASIRARTS